MIFYLSPSKWLFFLFLFLYLSMMSAVQFSSLCLSWKFFIILILVYYGTITIKEHALRVTPHASRRICFRVDTLYVEDKSGKYVSGKFTDFVYLSKLLIILSIITTNKGKKNKIKTVLITSDALPPLQFRRLSMQSYR